MILQGAQMDPALDRTLLALADPTRRAILRRLMADGQARVTELARPFEMSLNAVSKHIRVLERAQLVRRQRSGREHMLSFHAAPLDDAAAWIAAQQAFWSARLGALDQVLGEQDRAAAPRRRRKGRSP
jgi:DNA-binding transcriptional ArsR family regulator